MFCSGQRDTERYTLWRFSDLSGQAPPVGLIAAPRPRWPAEAVFGSVGGLDLGASRARRLRHYREAFVSNVDGVLAIRLSCEEEESGKSCLRRVVGGLVALGVDCLVSVLRVRRGLLRPGGLSYLSCSFMS